MTRVGDPAVAILLATYCGGRFLPTQLDSFERQSFTNWRLFASDDGSLDDTLPILDKFQQKLGPKKVQIRRGPGRGYVVNFLSLASEQGIQADYYAFSDQDDVWHPNKLTRALAILSKVPSQVPALYCSRTRLIDSEGHVVGFSPLFKRGPSFPNALVQNIAGGNTMVFNDAARRLLSRAGIVDVSAHDWWLYLLVCAVQGTVFYDHDSSVDYRVHGANAIGVNTGPIARIQRLRMLFAGRFKEWIDMNIAALTPLIDIMPEHNRWIFATLCDARREAPVRRLAGMWRSGVYRQTVGGNIGMIIGAILNKI